MTTVKITSIGGSTGIVLPGDVLEYLRVAEGDTLQIIETQNGIELTALDPEFDEQLAIAKRVMRADKNVLKKLAEQ